MPFPSRAAVDEEHDSQAQWSNSHRAAIDSFVAIQTFSVTFHIIAFVDYISSFARVKDLKHYCMYI
jgi:hypothetical protein